MADFMTYRLRTCCFCVFFSFLFWAQALPGIAQSNPSWLGRPFVKVLQQGDPIPGTTDGVFNQLTAFTLHNGTLHIVAGQGQNQKGLFRWRDGALTSLVYTNTLAPSGARFDTVHFTTDEDGGILNFVGEVFYGRPSSIYALFQLNNGNIATVFETAHEYAGNSFLGFGYPVRAGNAVVWDSQFMAGGIMQQGIFHWDGVTLRTLVNGDTDLPGSLGLYTGTPVPYHIGFDGGSIGFVATDGNTPTRTNGVYRADLAGVITKLIDGNDKHPSNRTYRQRNATFANVDVAGTNSFFSVNLLVSAASENSFYSSDGFRHTGGTFNPATAVFGTDGLSEQILTPVDDQGTPVLLDGRAWNQIEQVDGQGDDVAFAIRMADGTLALYAAIGPATNPTVVTLISPRLTNGTFQFEFNGEAGKLYRIDFKSSLSDADWVQRAIVPGSNGTMHFSEPSANSTGFYQVTVIP